MAQQNVTEEDARAILETSNDATIVNSLFRGNGVSGNGGAIFNGGSDMSISNCVFNWNGANLGYGGAIYTTGGGSPVITNSTFVSNGAGLAGGAISDRAARFQPRPGI